MNKKIFIFEKVDGIVDFIIKKWMIISDAAADGRFTVAISGGKTPAQLYRTLTDTGRTFSWGKTHIFLIDERFVPYSNPDSNYGMIRRNLLDSLHIPEGNIHPVPIEKTPLVSAERYESTVKEFFNLKKGQLPIFDLVVLGIGADGHTASLFPAANAVYEKQRLAVSVRYPKLKHARITLTLPVINNAKNIIFFVTGEDKAQVIKEILEGNNTGLPASLVKPTMGNLFFLMDTKVSALLSGGLQTEKVDS